MKTLLYMYSDLTKEERFRFDSKNPVDYDKYVFLTVDQEIDFSAKIKIGDKTYFAHSCSHRGENYYLGVEEYKMKDDEDIDDENEQEITCPVCGYEEGDSWESSESDDDHECQRCGSTFSYEREISVTYGSTMVKKNTEFVELKDGNP